MYLLFEVLEMMLVEYDDDMMIKWTREAKFSVISLSEQ